MNKTQLARKVANDLGVPAAVIAAVTDKIIEAISKAALTGEAVTIYGFGTFRQRKRKARTNGRHPITKLPIQLPEGNTITFKPSKKLKP